MEIHLLNPLWEASGGSEWRTLTLFEELADHAEVTIWTEYTPDPSLRGRFPIREMLETGSFPQSGTFVFIGAYWPFGRWLNHAKPDRIVLVYNVVDPDILELRIAELESATGLDVELVFASAMLAEHANGRKGTVELSPINFDIFSPRDAAPSLAGLMIGGVEDLRIGSASIHQALPSSDAQVLPQRVVVGRHSQDRPLKHHPDDPGIYLDLVRAGSHVRILGGTCLHVPRSEIEPDGSLRGSLELFPAASLRPADFLRSLDVFFYQTDPSWIEGYGRVVAEAMGCGLPCVVGASGGYRQLIRHGENGFLFSNREEAVSQLTQLVESADLRSQVGRKARESVVALYENQRTKMLDFYLRPRRPAPGL